MMKETSRLKSPRLIRTPWGDLAPKVDLFPLLYLLLLYGVLYFLPFGLFDLWRKGEDGLAEWLQFLAYFGAAICASGCFFNSLRKAASAQWICWLLITFFCFYYLLQLHTKHHLRPKNSLFLHIKRMVLKL